MGQRSATQTDKRDMMESTDLDSSYASREDDKQWFDNHGSA